MNWKPAPTALFWVPVPYTGQPLASKIEWMITEGATRESIRLINPDNKQEYNAVIIDYSGVYDMAEIPGWIARQCTDIEEMTGLALAALLRKRIQEFSKANKIVFYQVTIKK